MTQNNKIYEHNLNFLKNKKPEIYNKIINSKDSGKYQLIKNSNDEYYNIFYKDSNTFHYNSQNTVKDIEKNLISLGNKNSRIAVFLGLGLGYDIVYYLKNMSKDQKTRYLVIIEDNIELFKLAMMCNNLVPILEKNETFLFLNEENIFNKMTKLFQMTPIVYYIKTTKFFYHSSTLNVFRDSYMEILKKIKDALIFTIGWFGNSPEDSLIGERHMFDNIKEIIENPGINLLYDKFKNKPAVIVATGPSLNKNKHLLKNFVNKAIFICPDASLKILLDIGIKPNLVTALERDPETADLIKGFSPEDVKDVYYAATPVIPHTAYEAYNGPKIIVYRNYQHFNWLEIDKGMLEIKQSSGNMAFKLAEALGCNPIILVGQDLAYSRDGTTHAEGALFGENQEHTMGNIKKYEVPGNDGKPILTHDVWDLFRKGYEIDIETYKGTCINATEGGALINGTKIMTLKDVLDNYISEIFNPDDIIKENFKVFNSDSVRKDFNKVMNKIKSAQDDLIFMSKVCKDAIDIIDEKAEDYKLILEGNDSKELFDDFEKTFNKIFNMKKSILSKYDTFQKLLMHIFQSFYIKFENDCNLFFEQYDSDKKANAAIFFNYRRWFLYENNLNVIILNLLEEAKNKINEQIKKSDD